MNNNLKTRIFIFAKSAVSFVTYAITATITHNTSTVTALRFKVHYRFINNVTNNIKLR